MIWKLAIGAGIVGGIAYALKMSRTSTQLETVTRAKIHKLDLTGMTIRVDVTLKNPTGGSLSIKYPFVKLIYKDATIGTSQVTDKDIKVPSHGEAKVERIMINIPYGGLFSIAGAMIQSLNTGQSVKLVSKTISTIDLGWKKLPYDKTEIINLTK